MVSFFYVNGWYANIHKLDNTTRGRVYHVTLVLLWRGWALVLRHAILLNEITEKFDFFHFPQK